MQRAEERIGRGGATGELRSLVEAVWRSVAARGDEVALASKGAGGSWCETIYGELWRCVERLAAGQASLGVVERDVEEARFAAYERPKKLALLPRELSQEAGELTPKLSVKLRVVKERYAEEIAALYA